MDEQSIFGDAYPKLLVYQDIECQAMLDYLAFRGFSVTNSTNEDVYEKLKNQNYDLCILSHYKTHLPGDLRLLTYLKSIGSKIPVIMLSGQFQYEYIIKAFNEGVDDYVVRPYNLEELICRIKAVLRRTGLKTREFLSTYAIGEFVLDVNNKTLSRGIEVIHLSIRETKLAAFLCAYMGEVLPKNVIMTQIWKDDTYYSRRSLDVHICKLRNFLKSDPKVSITTIARKGYFLSVKA